ncbi:MAG: UDP-3-O-(3-hydroxymyristoyl)glucosamine N-acyltransferase [Bacteroidota bacterium]
MQFTAQDLATILQATIEGDPSVSVHRPGKIESATAGAITFLANPRYEDYLYTTEASIVVVSKELELKSPVAATLIRVADPYQAFAALLHHYDQAAQARPEGISPLAQVDEQAQVGKNVAIGRFATIERGAIIEDDVVIFDQVYVGANARIGAGTVLHPGARVLHHCELGKQCVIYANAVIGSDGFGYVPDDKGVYSKIPQVGIVVLEDTVEIGANATIDRATLGETRIGQGAKLDNLVQIGHNVTIGAHTVIAAQTGVAGSTKIGKHCMIGGQVGFAGHIEIADGSKFQAQSGIAATIEEPGQAFFGSPAIPYRDYIRSYGVFKKLPDLYRQLHRLERELERLKNERSEV